MSGKDFSRLECRRNLWCCNYSAGRTNSSFFSLVLLSMVFLSLVHNSTQVLEFLDEPSLYYYIKSGFATIIPCQVVDVDSASGSQTSISATFSINGTPILDQQDLPPNHEVWVEGPVVLGLLITEAVSEFSGWTYSCRAERGGQVLMSLNSTLYVGDGRPLAPVEDPCYMTDAGLTSLTLMWGYAPVPPDAPLLGYNITYWSLNEPSVHESLETNDNATTITLRSLSPGVTYVVVVQGINRLGAGTPSAPVQVTVMMGSLPPAPTGVMADVELANQSVIVVGVKWKSVELDAAESTPLLDYNIYYKESEPVLIKTVNASSVSATVELKGEDIGMEFVIGVAARNLAGQSDISYSDVIHIVVSTGVPSHSVSFVLVGGIVGAVVLLVFASVFIFILIICFRRWTSSIYHVHSSGTPDKSPEITRKHSTRSLDALNGLFEKDGETQMSEMNHSNHNHVNVTVEVQEEKLNDTVRVKRPSLDYIRNNPSSSAYYESRTL